MIYSTGALLSRLCSFLLYRLSAFFSFLLFLRSFFLSFRSALACFFSSNCFSNSSFYPSNFSFKGSCSALISLSYYCSFLVFSILHSLSSWASFSALTLSSRSAVYSSLIFLIPWRVAPPLYLKWLKVVAKTAASWSSSFNGSKFWRTFFIMSSTSGLDMSDSTSMPATISNFRNSLAWASMSWPLSN